MKTLSRFFIYKGFVLTFISIIWAGSAFAQEPLIAVGVNAVSAPSSANMSAPVIHDHSAVAKKGTYQIMHIQGKPEETVPQSLINLIESYRAESVMIYMKTGENTWIKILPYNLILSPDFKPVANDVFTDELLSDN